MTNDTSAGAQGDAPPSDPSVETQVTICNERGLHARASAKFVHYAGQFDATITVTRDSQSVGGTSIMGLMMLAAGPGSTIKIAADGHDAAAALESLVALVEDGFGETDKSTKTVPSNSVDEP